MPETNDVPPRGRSGCSPMVVKAKRLARWLLARVHPTRRWIIRNRIQSMGIGMALTGLLVMAALAGYVSRDDHQSSQTLLDTALAVMDQGRYARARQLVATLRNHVSDISRLGGGPAFVQGASAAYEAQSMWDERYRAKFYLVAARYLVRARDEGWPRGRDAEGLLLLGKSLYESGQYGECIPVLQQALARNPEKATELHALLSSAYERNDPPDLAAALRLRQQQLADGGLSGDARQQAICQQSEILYRLGQFRACRASLDRIPSGSTYRASAFLLRARMLLDEGDQLAQDPKRAAAKYNQAIQLLRDGPGQDAAAHSTTSKFAYLIGVALRKLHRYDDARKQLSLLRRSHTGTAESLAAGVEEAEVLQSLGQFQAALEAYQQVLREAGRPEAYDNPWISLELLRQRTLRALDSFLQAKRFAEAVGLARSCTPIIPRVRAVEAEAKAHRAWAQYLLGSAAPRSPSQREAARNRSYEQQRRAGRTFAQLARLRYAEREYPNDLWNAALGYLQGHDYRHAVRVLQAYLNVESRRRRPDALVGLGKALLALGEIDQSLSVLNECIEFYPKDPAVYEAHLLAARAYVEKGDLQRAKQLLSDSIHNEDLTPRSQEWQDSLFELGRIHYREATVAEAQNRLKNLGPAAPDKVREGLAALETAYTAYQQAIRLLAEAVKRYPHAPQTIEARYLIAQAHGQSAKLPEMKRSLTTIGPVRVTLRKQQQQELQRALDSYRQLQVLLTKKQERAPLARSESAILRNCYFGQGDALLKLGRFEQAIRVYSAATSRYQQRPEAIEAFVQIADCYRQLHQTPEARGTIEQAKVVLGRLDKKFDFTETTRYSRSEWSQLLDWMSTL